MYKYVLLKLKRDSNKIALSTHVKSSFCFLVTSHCRHILSNGNSLRLAVLCIIAVNSDCGLKKPANQTQEGS